jgi:hypothetical protein
MGSTRLLFAVADALGGAGSLRAGDAVTFLPLALEPEADPALDAAISRLRCTWAAVATCVLRLHDGTAAFAPPRSFREVEVASAVGGGGLGGVGGGIADDGDAGEGLRHGPAGAWLSPSRAVSPQPNPDMLDW